MLLFRTSSLFIRLSLEGEKCEWGWNCVPTVGSALVMGEVWWCCAYWNSKSATSSGWSTFQAFWGPDPFSELGSSEINFISLPFLYWDFYSILGISFLHVFFLSLQLLKNVTSLGYPPKYLNRPVILALLLLWSQVMINEKLQEICLIHYYFLQKTFSLLLFSTCSLYSFLMLFFF